MGIETPRSHETESIIPVSIGDVIRFDRSVKPISHGRDHLVIGTDGDSFHAISMPRSGSNELYGSSGTEFMSRGGYEVVDSFTIDEVLEALAKSFYGTNDISQVQRDNMRKYIA